MRPLVDLLALVLSGQLAVAPAAGACEVVMNEPRHLIGFSGAERNLWTAVNDGVMGGVSRSEISSTDRGTGLFTGYLSLENNGGFASVRTPVVGSGLDNQTGLEIRVRGDGRVYQLRLRTDDRFDGVSYRALFVTRNQEWLTFTLPFELFQPTFRGRILSETEFMDPSRIRQLAFMVADKTQGSFALEIDFVRAWTQTVIAP